ncbi:hypothetical protein TNCT_391951 [Trichonephila clavata]|uniref:Uncharacterized protein n=1 Tax=Trichonephila clavata TaxID=2740835 RepID=A0A8X6FLE3_TRICU|nr:hypothetical protein TNCT_391951 [Trichonephila clavata]
MWKVLGLYGCGLYGCGMYDVDSTGVKGLYGCGRTLRVWKDSTVMEGLYECGKTQTGVEGLYGRAMRRDCMMKKTETV